MAFGGGELEKMWTEAVMIQFRALEVLRETTRN
jgi:hypothetical protein